MNLPSLKQLMLPAYFSLRKGVRIGQEDIYLKQRFEGVFMDEEQRKAYCDFFGFRQGLPLPLLYPLAQRAHLALMLDKRFTIAVPGLVHLENTLLLYDEVDHTEAFELIATVKVPSRESGSLLPFLTLDYLQKGKRVARCESLYLAKRKSAKSSSKKEKTALSITAPAREEAWQITPTTAKRYGDISGDKNPIHASVLFAKMVGFKKRIIHGWYNASRACASTEEHFQKEAKSLKITFLKPVYLPSSANFLLDEKGSFIIRKGENNLVEGKTGF